jgi:hypothetical protein
MATSNSIDFNLPANRIIKRALQLLTVIGPGDSVEAEDYTVCLDLLNGMLKLWQTQGLHVWTKHEAVLFLEEDRSSYDIYGDSLDHNCYSSDFLKTTIGADEAIGQTVLTIGSSSGIVIGDTIGVVQDDNTIHWTTVDAIPDGTSVTLDSALTVAASEGNNVYVYSSLLLRPIDIKNIRYVYSEGTTFMLRRVSRAEFYSISNREQSSGPPNMAFVDFQTDRAIVHLYPTPNEVNDRIEFTYTKVIEDMDNATDDLDFPQKWLQTVVYNLAVIIAPVYQKEEKVAGLIATLADQYLKAAKDFDQERTSLKIRPKLDY